jgi:hypothetical protein
VYADDEIILGDNINTIQEVTEVLIRASKGAGLEEKKCMLMYRHQNAGKIT